MAPSAGDDSNALVMPRTDGQGDDSNEAGSDLHNDASGKRLGISILMPSYNPGEYFQSAIESALWQLSEDDEIVVQDAQSTDGSAEYLTKLGEIDPRVIAVIEKDDGQSDALNRALARATKPWVIWLNADDMLLDSSLAALRDEVRSDPDVDLVIGAHQVIRADGSLVETYPSKTFDTYEMVKWGCAASSGSIMMRTEFLRTVGGFDTELDTVMDLALQLRMAEAHPRQIVIDAPIGAFRFHEMSKSTNQSLRFIRESHSVRMRYAMSGKQRARASVATVMHCVLCSTLPIRLTPGYRSLRRRVARRVAR